MAYYINSIITFSDKGFDLLDRTFFNSNEISEIKNIQTKYLEGKGLRYVPKTAKILNNVVAHAIELESILVQKDLLGVYNTNDVGHLESNIDFDFELKNYGVNLANPMKIPYTINGSILGWIAIKHKLTNICLTMNAGRCGLFSAINNSFLDIKDKKINKALILGAHFSGDAYKNYNFTASFNKEVGYGILMSCEEKKETIAEIVSCSVGIFKEDLFYSFIKDNPFYTILDANNKHNLTSTNIEILNINQYSNQSSFFPFFIKNIKSYRISNDNIFNYITIDSNLFMACVSIKLLN